MKNQDYKNYRARPRLNKDRIITVCLTLAFVIGLSVSWDRITEPKLTECGPTMEMGMPIAIEDWVRT